MREGECKENIHRAGYCKVIITKKLFILALKANVSFVISTDKLVFKQKKPKTLHLATMSYSGAAHSCWYTIANDCVESRCTLHARINATITVAMFDRIIIDV